MSKFEEYLDLIIDRNKSEITKQGDIIDYPDLDEEQLNELCCLYAVEDNCNHDKDEILGANYNDNAAEFVEWVARLCSNEYYYDPEEKQEYLSKINKIATQSIVKFYENKVNIIYCDKMHELMQEESFKDAEEE